MKLTNKSVLIDGKSKPTFVILVLELKDAKLKWVEELSELEVKNQRVKLNLPNATYKALATAIIKEFNRTKKPTVYKRELIGIYIKQIGTFYTKS